MLFAGAFLLSKAASFMAATIRRFFRRNSQNMFQAATPETVVSFDGVWPEVLDALVAEGMKMPEISIAMQRFKQVCDYNVPHGKKNRGITVVQSYKSLMAAYLTANDVHIARVVGWCIEFLQASLLVADDIMDESVSRRGQPCWYKQPAVGIEAVNDAFFLESAVYVLLKKYCSDRPYYVDLVELFQETILQTVIGQCLDMRGTVSDTIDFANYTEEKYKAIAKWKTAFYSFYLPIATAMHMAGIKEREVHVDAKHILTMMGEYFQVQDDYLDCFGDPEVTGKVGTDIEDRKCSWLLVQALKRAGPAQKQILQENYGKKTGGHVCKVKQLYVDLNLQRLFADYEHRSYCNIVTHIKRLGPNFPKQMLLSFVNKIYKRAK